MDIDTIENKHRLAEILLVEDNYGDVILTKKAFEHSNARITVAMSGEEALAMLHREGPHSEATIPDLILLDLNLPQKSGREVLSEIKADQALKHIPVIVLTSSRAELDVVKTYRLNANSYIIKPVNLEKFNEVVEAIKDYWFSVVVLAPN